jgi:hypothetical protein
MPKSLVNQAKSSPLETGSALNLKAQLQQKKIKRENRQKFFKNLIPALVVGLIIAFPLAAFKSVLLAAIAALAIPVIWLSYCYPLTALWLFLIYMPFSGTVTYWIGNGNALFQLSKDALYLPALGGLMQRCWQKKQPIWVVPALMPTFLILIGFSLLTLILINGQQQWLIPDCELRNLSGQALHNANGDYLIDTQGDLIAGACKSGIPIIQGLLGLKVLIGYVPLIFCAYYLIEDRQKLNRLGRLLILITLVTCSLGIAQYWLLKTGHCVGTRGMSGVELYQASLEAKCLVGGSLLYSPEQGQIRLPGTFVSPWHWAWFLVGNAAISFIVTFCEQSRFWRLMGLLGMALVFINAVICGQRLALALVPTLIFVLLILTGQFANFKRFLPLIIVLPLVLFIGFSFFNPSFIQERINSFVDRWNQAPPYVFIQQQFSFTLAKSKGILGQGLGTATNSTRTFGPVFFLETYHPKLLFELGFGGLFLFMIFITHLTILTFKSYRSLKDKNLRSWGSSFWVFILIIGYFPYWYPLDTDPVAVYYWFFAGIIFKLPDLEKMQIENSDVKIFTPRKKLIRSRQEKSLST